MHATTEQRPLQKRERFVPKYLDPASRLGEILFGLIMVLTVTLVAGVTIKQEGRAAVRELLFAAIGCNIAWGIIDAVLYIMNCITVRSGKLRLIKAVQDAPNAQTALALIENEIEPELQELLAPEEARAFNESVLNQFSRVRLTKTLLTREDVYGAIACFWLVFAAPLPAALPFLVFSQPLIALRVSNLILMGLLFFAGYKWAEYVGINRFLAGTAMVGIGLILVAVAIPLGG